MDRVTVAEAAARLGLSKDAVRQRIRRDTIEYERDEKGNVYVLLSPDITQHDTISNGVHNGGDATLRDYIETLKRELEHRNEELRRKDHIIAALVERVPELEPPRESTVSDSVNGVRDNVPQDKPQPEKPVFSFWRRLFGLEVRS